jgi:phage terminase large subunit
LTAKPEYKPRQYFLPVHERKERYAVLVIHRRAGKTVCLINELIERALYTKKRDGQFFYVCPTAKQAKRNAWNYLLRYTKHCRRKKNESELWVELLNGSRVFVIGADDPDSMRGLYIDGIVLDEAAQIKPHFWTEIVRPAISDRKGWVVFSGTPKGKANLLYAVLQKARQRPEKWFQLVLTVEDTKILGVKELEEIREDLDDSEYQQEYMCSFDAALVGSYYGKHLQILSKAGKVKPGLKYDPTLPVSLAMDIGYNDACSIWFWQVNEGSVNFIDYWEGSGFDAAEVAEKLDLLPYAYDTWWIPHDAFHKTFASKKSVFDTFLEYGAPARRVPDPDPGNRVWHGIDATRKVLRTYPIQIDSEKCAQGLECLKNYSRAWNTKTLQFDDTPRHDKWSHGADAFRYACLSIDPNEIARSIQRMIDRKEIELANAIADVRDNTIKTKISKINMRMTLDQAVEQHKQALRRQRAAGHQRV